MRILFISSTRLGDAVLSTGLLDHLLRRYPHARFTVACGPVAAGVFARMPRCDRVLVVTKRRWDLHWLALWRACAATRWDLCVDVRGSATTFFLWTRRRAVMRGGRRPGARIVHLGRLLGLTPPPLPVAWTDARDRARAEALLPGQGWIALAPTANWSGKVWPAERFVALCRLLRAETGLRPVVVYGPGETERAMAAPVLAALADAVDTGGGLALPEVAAVLGRCALFVGNDSGLMHLSAAVGTPTLGLFGPSRVSEYAPVGARTAHVVAPGPDGRAPIAGLTVEEAAQAARALLRRGEEAGQEALDGEALPAAGGAA